MAIRALRSELAEEAAAREQDRLAAEVRSEERETALRRELAVQRAASAREEATALSREEQTTTLSRELRTALGRDEELRTALRREEERQTALSRAEAAAQASLEAAEVRVEQLSVLNRARSAVGEHSSNEYTLELQECACYKYEHVK